MIRMTLLLSRCQRNFAKVFTIFSEGTYRRAALRIIANHGGPKNGNDFPHAPVLLVPEVGGAWRLLGDGPHLVERQPVHQAAVVEVALAGNKQIKLMFRVCVSVLSTSLTMRYGMVPRATWCQMLWILIPCNSNVSSYTCLHIYTRYIYTLSTLDISTHYLH